MQVLKDNNISLHFISVKISAKDVYVGCRTASKVSPQIVCYLAARTAAVAVTISHTAWFSFTLRRCRINLCCQL